VEAAQTWCSGGKTLAILASAPGQHLTTTHRRHARAKAVAPLAHENARLKCPFHSLVSIRFGLRANAALYSGFRAVKSMPPHFSASLRIALRALRNSLHNTVTEATGAQTLLYHDLSAVIA
jgi:hypothetical protein